PRALYVTSLLRSASNARSYHHPHARPTPNLYSFPTRRSSDLSAGAWRAGGAPRATSRCDRSTTARPYKIAHPEPGHCRGWRSGRDRKSTRLNSSHQIISYAVFCLKKKKILNLFVIAIYVIYES